jgi:hypothetical protein
MAGARQLDGRSLRGVMMARLTWSDKKRCRCGVMNDSSS